MYFVVIFFHLIDSMSAQLSDLALGSNGKTAPKMYFLVNFKLYFLVNFKCLSLWILKCILLWFFFFIWLTACQHNSVTRRKGATERQRPKIYFHMNQEKSIFLWIYHTWLILKCISLEIESMLSHSVRLVGRAMKRQHAGPTMIKTRAKFRIAKNMFHIFCLKFCI